MTLIEPPSRTAGRSMACWDNEDLDEAGSFDAMGCEKMEPSRERHFQAGAAMERLIVGQCAVLREVLRQVAIVAPMDSTILILGETGTGKELIADAVHRQSSRRNKSLVKVNCAAMPAGLL